MEPFFDQDVLGMDDETKIQLAEKYREIGKVKFQNKELEAAFHHFAQGIKCLILINPKSASKTCQERKKALLPVLQNNAANCHMVKGNWEHVIDLTNSVLQVEPENVKALYRRGIAFMEIQEYEKSATDLYDALELEPNNKAIKAKLNLLNERLKKFNEKSAGAMKDMFK